MQARRHETFVTDHIVLSTVALIVIVGLVVTIAIQTLGLQQSSPSTGGSSINAPSGQESQPVFSSAIGFDPGHVSAGDGHSPAADSAGIGVNREAVSAPAAPRSWGVGVGPVAGSVTEDADAGNRVQQLPGFGIGFDPGNVTHHTTPQITGLDIGPTE